MSFLIEYFPYDSSTRSGSLIFTIPTLIVSLITSQLPSQLTATYSNYIRIRHYYNTYISALDKHLLHTHYCCKQQTRHYTQTTTAAHSLLITLVHIHFILHMLKRKYFLLHDCNKRRWTWNSDNIHDAAS